MNVMSHKGYFARVEYDAEDEIFFGRLAGITDGVGFHADTVSDLKAAFHEAVDDYIETCAKAARAAALAGKSLNQWAAEVLAEAATEDA
ncbi:type II toxin-antitoxin system HicB family antitoxin [Rhizobium sp. 9140]|uniref:type II toxin-antitoxin system HicB family antitoxin n=1 Tax=Rhizobium sp. 9140 TaxID=1761900 RepID=UPI000797005A|nr:type II toxin-antitoxin system HicB family antitoxin [Rhizobium sp. 9140]CZT34522.1 Predicted nuclease of the RNAse H fold, HicB family [Rhizobium sp. 9140]